MKRKISVIFMILCLVLSFTSCTTAVFMKESSSSSETKASYTKLSGTKTKRINCKTGYEVKVSCITKVEEGALTITLIEKGNDDPLYTFKNDEDDSYTFTAEKGKKYYVKIIADDTKGSYNVKFEKIN